MAQYRGIIVPPTVTYLHYSVSSSTLTAVELFQSLDPQSGTLCRTSSGTRPSVQTVSDVYLKRVCLLDNSTSSALGILDDNRTV